MKVYKTFFLSMYRIGTMSSMYSSHTPYAPPSQNQPAFQYQQNTEPSPPNPIMYITPRQINETLHPELVQCGVVYASDPPQFYPIHTQQPIQYIVDYTSVPPQGEQSRDLSHILNTVNSLTEERLNELKAKIDQLEQQLTDQVEAKIKRCCLLF